MPAVRDETVGLRLVAPVDGGVCYICSRGYSDGLEDWELYETDYTVGVQRRLSYMVDGVAQTRMCSVCLDSGRSRQSTKHFECNVCGLHRIGVPVYASAEWPTVCHACYEDRLMMCECCEAWWDNESEAGGSHAGYDICPDCHWNGMHMCTECGRWIDSDSDYEGSLCYSCYEDRESTNNPVNSWDYRPYPAFKRAQGEAADPEEKLPYMGWELEMEFPYEDYRDSWEVAREVWDDCIEPHAVELGAPYLKSDGSLNFGAELVSNPGTPAYWREKRKALESMLDALRSAGVRSYAPQTCGIHIHVNVAAFKSNLHLFRFQKMFYDNIPLTMIVSQRLKRQVGSWCNLDGESQRKMLRKAKDKFTDHRYTAVNITSRTAEVRVYRGTLNYKSFVKNLEHCEAVFEYTKECSNSQCTTPLFLEWLEKNRRKYSVLWEFLQRKWFGAASRAAAFGNAMDDPNEEVD